MERAERAEWRRERQDWGPGSRAWSGVEGMGAMHGAMSHGCQGVEAWGPCDGHGKGAWGRGGVRAGRAKRAGMHWGPLKSCDRGMGPRGQGKRAWGKGCVGGGSHVKSWAMSWSRGRGHGGHGMEWAERAEGLHGGMGWGERGGRSGRAWIGALSSHLIGAWGHGAMGRVCGWWQPCETWGHELEPLKECQNIHEVGGSHVGSWGHELEPGSRAWRHGGHAMERAERAEWRRERQDYGSSLAPPPLKAGVGG